MFFFVVGIGTFREIGRTLKYIFFMASVYLMIKLLSVIKICLLENKDRLCIHAW